MIPQHLQALADYIDQIDKLTPEEKGDIGKIISKIKLESESNHFKHSNTEKDRTLVISYLQNTIDDLEKNHRQLQQANELLLDQNQIIDNHLNKLVEAYQDLEQFTYIASHDLKAPLRTIGSYSQLIKTRYASQLDDKAMQYLNMMITSVTQLTQVIDDSLKFSSIGKNSLNNASLHDLNHIMDIVKQNLQEEISNTSALIHYHNLPKIHGRQSILILLFEHLLQNAIKFRAETTPTLLITSKTTDDLIEICVIDNGRGIDPKYLKKIFNPFQKIDAKDMPGTGIGLAICKKIVNLYGGDISCESELGKGSTFTIQFANPITA